MRRGEIFLNKDKEGMIEGKTDINRVNEGETDKERRCVCVCCSGKREEQGV